MCCVHAQIPYLGKVLFMKYRAKMLLANPTAGFLNHLFLQKRLMKQPHFFHVDKNSQKLIVDQKFFGWTWSTMGVANLVSRL